MAGERTFVVKFISDTAGAVSGFGKLSSGLGGLQKSVTNSIPGFKLLAAGATAALGGITAGLVASVKAAMDDQKSQAELQRQLEKTFGANEALTESAERYISVTQLRTGESDTNLRESLGTLVRATGDLTKSQTLLNTAQDISAATGKDLASVSLALAKASQGQFTALSRLGIPLDEATKKSKDFDKVLGLLNDQFGGASQTAANTFGGQLKILGGQFGEIVESIGAALLPYLQRFTDFLVKNVAPAVQRVTTVMGEKGLGAAFQQLIFESGSAGPKVVGVFKTITVAAAEALNLLAKAYYVTSATFKLTTRDFVGAAKDFYKATQNFIDVGSISKKFDAIAVPINNYKSSIRDTINQQTSFKGSVEELAGDENSGLKGAAKTVKTAKEKLEEYTDALQKSTSAQRAFDRAQKDTKSAETDLATAKSDVSTAQENLNRAIAGYGADSVEAQKAQKDLEKAQRSVERAGYRVEQSVFAVADAEKELAEVRADPESTPQAIREAEINLAEAKLATKDAIDSQIEATDELASSQSTLNELVNGAIVGSAFYTQFSDILTDAKKRQTDAEDRLADAIGREAEAQERLNDANEKAAELAKKYPKIAATVPQTGVTGVSNPVTGIPNPAADGVAAHILARQPMFGIQERMANREFPKVEITVNAGLGASGVQVGQEIDQYLKEYANFTGQSYSFGSIGSLF